MYKAAVANNYMFDAVRFDQQKFNWNLKDFDRYSSAFAFGLVESGFAPGDKVFLWVDQNNSAEVLVATMGAAKAGVTVVTHNEKDDIDALHHTLKDSGARGLVFSPNTEGENGSRATFLQKLMPELSSLYPGDALNLSEYPMLKQIVQTGHSNLPGVIKYKDALVYANPALSNFQLPQNDANSTLYECYRDGVRVAEHTSGDVASQASSLWNENFSVTHGDETFADLFNVEVNNGKTSKPVFMSVDLETPLGFASFLANASNQRKVFIPASTRMTNILKSVSRQKSTDLVCDQEFFEMEPPARVASDYKEACSSVQNAVVAGSGSANSTLFSARTVVVDPLTLQ